ncbi:hydrogenase accessory protein [Mangrovicoccus sp. HB161399]|uniref:hydrogenase accessory protein n=1 Tax=Mangrovicoccus sp. HB161399 TaxID=2720392 RepID=UPI0015534442|nr:hydrogenase accessory protein [Mangrovicoccus sp. HB161399]
MIHPLIDRLTTEFRWPRLETPEDVAAYTSGPGWHVVFVPGDPKRNLESADVAVILPELHMVFQRAFDCAVASDAVESALRQDTGVLKAPSLLFWRDGSFVSGIAKVRDWDDYIRRIQSILSQPAAA